MKLEVERKGPGSFKTKVNLDLDVKAEMVQSTGKPMSKDNLSIYDPTTLAKMTERYTQGLGSVSC